jgi:hypothetical protein
MNGGLQQSARVAAAVDREMSRDAQLIALRIAAPKRAGAGRIIAAQDDASDCPLFRAADEPRLL